MFTIKLYKNEEDGTHKTTALACPHYDSYDHTDGSFALILYKNHLAINGTEYHINSPRPESYDIAYVENEMGKTVDRIGPKPSKEFNIAGVAPTVGVAGQHVKPGDFRNFNPTR